MIAEIVSNGMLSLPAALAVVGIVPGAILIAFLGIFALYTSLVLVDFKLRHPQVHNMGDAGLILGGPILREILAAGTVIFAVCATGSQLLAGQITLSTLSDNKLCLMLYTGIFTIPTLILSFPRTLDQLSILSILSCICILVAGLVGMSAAGALENPKTIKVASSASFFGDSYRSFAPIFC
jgi:amino acid permease